MLRAGGQSGLAIKSQCLLRDLGDALGFMFGHGDIVERRVREIAVVAQQKEQIGDRFQGIVDLVSDRGGKAAGRGQFLGLAQGFFVALAVAGIQNDDARPSEPVVAVVRTG